MERWSILLLLLLQLSVLPSQGHRWRKHHNRAFRCRKEGLFSDPTNCAKFHRCVYQESSSHYSLLTISCPQGLVYNDRIKSCSKHSLSRRCQTLSDISFLNRTYTEKNQENQQLPCEKEGYFAHPYDCKKFYRCIDYDGKGKSFSAFEYYCPKKLLFNKELNSCDWPNFTPACQASVEENHKPQMEKKTAHNSQKHTVESSRDKIKFNDNKRETDEIKCEKEGYFRNPKNCKKFYRCVDSSGSGKKFHIYHFKCPQSLIFDEKLSTCNWPAKKSSCEVRIDETTAKTTPLGSLEKHKPTQAPSTKEENLPCVKHGFFRHPTNCSKFFRCVKSGPHYKSYIFSCPKKLVFDENSNSCNWPDKSAPCIDNFIPINKPPAQVIVNTQHFRDKTRANRYPRSLTLHETAPSFPYLSSVFYATPRRTVTGSFVAKHGPGSNLTCEKEGVFKHPQYCHEFYVCSDFNNDKKSYTIFEFVCPNDMVYDEGTDDCAQPPPDSPCAHHKPEKCEHDGSEESDSQKPSEGTSESPDQASKDDSGVTKESVSSTTASSKSSEDSAVTVPGDDQSPTTPESKKDDSPGKENTTAPIKCKKSGYFRHPEDCNRFYRCVDFDNDGKHFVIYEFRCGEGLVFDEENSVCNWPSSVPSCDSSASEETSEGAEGGTATEKDSTTPEDKKEDTKSPDGTKTTSKDDATTTGSPSTSEEITGSKATPKPEDKDDTGSSDETKTSTTKSDEDGIDSKPTPEDSTEKKPTLKPGSKDKGSSDEIECTEAGFFRNPKNCSKFYRCVNDSDDGKSFRIFHFDCPSGLVFDEVLSVCNWPDQVDPPCGNKTEESGSKTTTESEGIVGDGSTPKDGTDTEGKKDQPAGSSTTPSKPDSAGEGSTTEDNEISKDDCPKKPGDKDTSKEPSSDQKGEGGSKPASGEKDSGASTEDSSSGIDSSTIECKKPGYFRNPTNCSKFYRCVGKGSGPYRIYHFECPSNLVFDEVSSVCNWPDRARPPCKKIADSSEDKKTSGTTTGKETEISTGTGTTPIDSGKGDEASTDSGKGDISTSSTEATSMTTISSEDTSEKSTERSSTPKADESKERSSTTSTPTSEIKDETTTKQPGDKESESTTGDGADSGLPGNDECKKEGYYRNPNNCSKFYRCVDSSGDGKAFQIYHFDCPSNLVFDEVLNVCNWPDQAQPPCKQDNASREEDNKGSTGPTIQATTESSHEKTSGEQETGGVDSGTTPIEEVSSTASEGSTDCPPKQSTQSSVTTGSSKDGAEPTLSTKDMEASKSTEGGELTSTSPSSEDGESATSSEGSDSAGIQCKEEGFFRHPEDCSKFYRCVNNNGSSESFTIYHFDCPENTAFDDILDVCVWPDQARPPCEEGASKDSKPDEPGPDTSSTESVKSTESPTGDGETTDSDGSQDISQSSSTESSEESTKSSTDDKYPTDSSSTDSGSSTSKSTIDDESSTSQPSGEDENSHKESQDNAGDCKKAGFFRHPKNCSKFYRCVDETGSGKSFIIYNFECPNNTMFDDILDVCVWPEQVRPPCSMDSSAEGITTSSPKETDEDDKETDDISQSSSTESTSLPKDTEGGEKIEPTSETVKETSSPGTENPTTKSSAISTTKKKEKPCPDEKPTKSPSTTSSTDSQSSEDSESDSQSSEDSESDSKASEDSGPGNCTKEGFFRNPDDCNKFYRCVDYGDGKTFKKYDFDCPENTVFDDVLDVCVWPGEERPPCSREEGENEEDESEEDTNIIPDGKERRRRQN